MCGWWWRGASRVCTLDAGCAAATPPPSPLRPVASKSSRPSGEVWWRGAPRFGRDPTRPRSRGRGAVPPPPTSPTCSPTPSVGYAFMATARGGVGAPLISAGGWLSWPSSTARAGPRRSPVPVGLCSQTLLGRAWYSTCFTSTVACRMHAPLSHHASSPRDGVELSCPFEPPPLPPPSSLPIIWGERSGSQRGGRGRSWAEEGGGRRGGEGPWHDGPIVMRERARLASPTRPASDRFKQHPPAPRLKGAVCLQRPGAHTAPPPPRPGQVLVGGGGSGSASRGSPPLGHERTKRDGRKGGRGERGARDSRPPLPPPRLAQQPPLPSVQYISPAALPETTRGARMGCFARRAGAVRLSPRGCHAAGAVAVGRVGAGGGGGWAESSPARCSGLGGKRRTGGRDGRKRGGGVGTAGKGRGAGGGVFLREPRGCAPSGCFSWLLFLHRS